MSVELNGIGILRIGICLTTVKVSLQPLIGNIRLVMESGGHDNKAIYEERG